jgi:predicted DsbA family dithiol-disulfide isomerase
VERFVDMWGLKGTILLDDTGEYAARLGVRGVPTNVLVDADGTVRAFGAARLDELYRAVDTMLER